MSHRAWRRTVATIALVTGATAWIPLAAGVAGLAAPVAAQAPDTAPWIDQIGVWARAVAEHRPGHADGAAQTIGSWSEADLDAVRTDLTELRALYRRFADLRWQADILTYRRKTFSAARIAGLLGLDASRQDVAAIDRLLERAAVLHADIAIRVTPYRFDSVGCSARSTVLVSDGRAVGAGCNNYHWRIARAWLDLVPPDPAADDFARLWYHATIVHLMEQTNYSDAQDQLTRGRAKFPDDAALLFEAGYYQEALAAPRVQVLAGTSRAILSAPAMHLASAESSYRRAVTRDPGLVEARVRLGAVLTRLGRHRDAAAMLRQALPQIQLPVLRYFADMFLARAAEGINDAAGARGHYERALAAFPAAPSPRLALGRLARSAGDRSRAEEFVQRAMDAQARSGQVSDPWWAYDLWQSRKSAELLTDLYRLVERGGVS